MASSQMTTSTTVHSSSPSRQRDRGTGHTATRWAGAVVLALCLGLAGLMLVPTLFGFQRYVVTGKSMTGAIDRGSVAFEKAVPVRQLHVGDVITFTPPASSGVHHRVTHRIAAIGQDPAGRPVFRTKGDANTARDPWKMTLDQATQPRVDFHVPYVGYALMALSDRHARMLLIGGPALIIAFLVLMTMWRQAGEEARESRSTPRPTATEVVE
jgi:signal peptidase I